MLSMIADSPLIHEVLNTWLITANISQADIARVTHRTTGGVSLVFTGKRKPSAQFIVQIAEACNRPPEEALRLIKILRPQDDTDAHLEQINHLYHTLRSETSKKQAVEYMRFLKIQEDQAQYNVHPKRKGTLKKK